MRASSRERRGLRQDTGDASVQGGKEAEGPQMEPSQGGGHGRPGTGTTGREVLRKGTLRRKCVESSCCQLKCETTHPFSKALWQRALETFRAFATVQQCHCLKSL